MMILLDRIVEIGIAVGIVSIIFFLLTGVLINASIAMVENKLNNITVSCSSDPIPGAIVISIEGSKFYCLIGEKLGGEFIYDTNN